MTRIKYLFLCNSIEGAAGIDDGDKAVPGKGAAVGSGADMVYSQDFPTVLNLLHLTQQTVLPQLFKSIVALIYHHNTRETLQIWKSESLNSFRLNGMNRVHELRYHP